MENKKYDLNLNNNNKTEMYGWSLKFIYRKSF